MVLPLETVQICFSKSKMLQPEIQHSVQAKRRDSSSLNAKGKPKIRIDDAPLQFLAEKKANFEEDLAEMSSKKIDLRKLEFIEWLEFLCRVATCVFVLDSKTALTSKNQAILRLVEDGRKPFAHQLASFLSVFLIQVLIEHTRRKMAVSRFGLGPEFEATLQQTYDGILDFEEATEQLD